MKISIFLLLCACVLFAVKSVPGQQIYADQLCHKVIDDETFIDCTKFTFDDNCITIQSEEILWTEKITTIEDNGHRIDIWTDAGEWTFYMNGNLFDRVVYKPSVGYGSTYYKENDYKRL